MQPLNILVEIRAHLNSSTNLNSFLKGQEVKSKIRHEANEQGLKALDSKNPRDPRNYIKLAIFKSLFRPIFRPFGVRHAHYFREYSYLQKDLDLTNPNLLCTMRPHCSIRLVWVATDLLFGQLL